MSLTPKTEKLLREYALKQIFGKLKRLLQEITRPKKLGQGEDNTGEFKAYQFGDALEKIDMTQSSKNAQIRAIGMILPCNTTIWSLRTALNPDEHGIDD